ncbi:phosphatidylinositol-binding protein scs2 [Cytospora paraplurivora]|uniref:Phosphatidylinositol-binding protein scs2 n=1 Tax=Cytospora paraplurivora TaxID=2898453 RepID=A0AAN9UDS5_9PEZI
MSVEIDPLELGFRRPFTVEVSQILKLRNPNKSPVAFKVKTTAPKQYCVRPNSGRIEPGHDVEVTVLLQAMKQDPPLDTKCRDKFLVQSVIISGDLEFSNVQTINTLKWDSVDKSQVQERKIRVNFLAPAGSDSAGIATPIKQQQHHLVNGVGSRYIQSVMVICLQISPQAEQTPDPVAAAYSSPDERRPTSSNAPPSEALSDAKEEPEVAAPIVSPVQSSNDAPKEVKSEVAAGGSREQEGLRQRKGLAAVSAVEDIPSASEVAAAVRPQGTEGVPIQIVAVLCLVSFLLAYFFF